MFAARHVMRNLALAAAMTATTVTMVSPIPAQAAYPGRNGRIAFGDNAGQTPTTPEIYSVRPDGTGLRQVTHNHKFDACAAYSPDGKRIAYCTGSLAAGDRHLDIAVMRADGRHKRLVTRMGGFSSFPDFAPDGRWLVFNHDEADGSADLWVISLKGRHLQRLTQTPDVSELFAAWSPDGSKIAFMRGTPGGTAQVWLREVWSGRERQLTFDNANKEQLPEWSPDSRHIAYNRIVNDQGDIWVMNANGSRQRPLTAGPADEGGPAWSPDGRKIAFVRSLPGRNRQLWTANAVDGGNQKILFSSAGGQNVPAWQPRLSHRRR
jgi:TolB protein